MWVPVRAATRIAALAEGEADLVIATMGHNTQRDAQARFIRPHYYRSETIVVGPRETPVHGMGDLSGRSICVTVGNYANANLVSQGARLMLFDDASRLPRGLLDETCLLAAQDDSFFASYLADPAFASRFEPKFGFDPVPWGMAVPKAGSERLAEALELISQIMHRDGEFLALARRNGIFTAFLEEQHDRWREPACAGPAASSDPACVLPALVAEPPPTSFAPQVEGGARVARTHRFGIVLTLPMLTSEPAWKLFREGVVNSLILVLGTLAATLLVALVDRRRLVGVQCPASRTGLARGGHAAVLAGGPHARHRGLDRACALRLLHGGGARCRDRRPRPDERRNAGQAIGEAAHSLRAAGRYPDRPHARRSSPPPSAARRPRSSRSWSTPRRARRSRASPARRSC